jgi:phycoerythrin-associated linker protein
MGNTTISSLVELWSTSSADDIQSVIRAVCKQMLGNPHVIDRERLTIAASQLLERSLSVRDTDQIQWLNRTAGKIFSIPKVI